jgi:glycosyltransferase involved in cell wall biosynthesis
MKISAFIPCYNNRETLADAVTSLRAQNHPADEIFVVDDGSTDGSAETVNVPVVRLEKNSGRGAARARGMETAHHELVLCCDAGKKLAPDFSEKALPWFADENVAAVFGRVVQPPSASALDRWRGRHLFRENAPQSAAVRRTNLNSGGCVLRAMAVKKVGGFNAALREHEDADLGARLLAADLDVILDPALLVVSNQRDGLVELMERYCRWNSALHGRMGFAAYLRQIFFSVKVMAREDVRAGDPVSAIISLLSPHWQFWSSIFK